MHEWRASAACRGMDPELFFSAGPIDRGHALAACRACPVARDCLRDALAFELGQKFYGIRGGLTAKDRRNLARRLRQRSAR